MINVRVRTVMIFGAAALAGALLLHTSQSVQIAEGKLTNMRESIQQEKESIRLLNAEWAYLNNPERLERLAKEYLKMMPPQPSSMVSEPGAIPARIEEIIASDTPSLQPVSLQAPPRKPKPPASFFQSSPSSNPSSSPIKSKPSDKDFTALLKDIRKGGKL